jgi:hypothetical protein
MIHFAGDFILVFSWVRCMVGQDLSELVLSEGSLLVDSPLIQFSALGEAAASSVLTLEEDLVRSTAPIFARE